MLQWLKSPTLWVVAFGYFIDILDVVLFSVLRVPSLLDLGCQGKDLLNQGVFLLNIQMLGMFLGSFFWGILSDKTGRSPSLLGTIALFSVANLCNGCVQSLPWYGVCRFLSGFGLSGEVGVSIALVTEMVPVKSRSVAMGWVAFVGCLGAITASLLGHWVPWRLAYVLSGVMGLAVVFFRKNIFETALFKNVQHSSVSKGDFFQFFNDFKRFFNYLNCFLMGVPIWFIIGILLTFAPECAEALSIVGTVTSADAILWAYVGIGLGDVLSAYLSEYFKSRKKVLVFFLGCFAVNLGLFFFLHQAPSVLFYAVCVFFGFSAGYWTLFATVIAEHFGTNLRATATSTLTNFVRASVMPLTYLLVALNKVWGFLPALGFLGVSLVVICLCAWMGLKETFGKDLDFLEQ